jgi:hypothetical protein
LSQAVGVTAGAPNITRIQPRVHLHGGDTCLVVARLMARWMGAQLHASGEQ